VVPPPECDKTVPESKKPSVFGFESGSPQAKSTLQRCSHGTMNLPGKYALGETTAAIEGAIPELGTAGNDGRREGVTALGRARV
jgi:hypothetical protein